LPLLRTHSGEWIAIDGTKSPGVSSPDSGRELETLRRALDSMKSADVEQPATIDSSAVQATMEKFRKHPETEVRFKPLAGTKATAYVPERNNTEVALFARVKSAAAVPSTVQSIEIISGFPIALITIVNACYIRRPVLLKLAWPSRPLSPRDK
jgi:hypothetical protein